MQRNALHGFQLDVCTGIDCWCLAEVDYTDCRCCADLRRRRRGGSPRFM